MSASSRPSVLEINCRVYNLRAITMVVRPMRTICTILLTGPLVSGFT